MSQLNRHDIAFYLNQDPEKSRTLSPDEKSQAIGLAMAELSANAPSYCKGKVCTDCINDKFMNVQECADRMADETLFWDDPKGLGF